jgi:hypothetical protein
LEKEIAELRHHQDNLARTVESQWAAVYNLQTAIVEARMALQADNDEAALRRRAEALRAVIDRIECTFIATGKRGGGTGKKNAILASVTIYPLEGDSVQYAVEREALADACQPLQART